VNYIAPESRPEAGKVKIMNDDADFHAALKATGLRGKWETDGESFFLQNVWWQSFDVYGDDEIGWKLSISDHDVDMDENGQSMSATDIQDDLFPTWIDAAKRAEALCRFD